MSNTPSPGGTSTTDLAIVGLGVILAGAYLFRDSIMPKKQAKVSGIATPQSGSADSRDFVAKMKASKKRLAIFYGSQTGTAEEYAIRLAKEAKSRFGLASLVCDPEEYDFDNLDDVPEDCAVIFVLATYGEGEPTDNAVQLMQNLEDSSFEFTKTQSHRLDGLKYVMFGLGNKTYEHYNVIARKADGMLEAAGAIRMGDRGEGDDDKSMEEDYLAWKDLMWPKFAEIMGVEEGAGGEEPDFLVQEKDTHPPEKVYLGELSARALTKTKGIHDLKNPYAAPISKSKELFQVGAERNCVHVELDIEGSGITYQHGDHVGVWPTNPDVEVDRMLCVLGLGAPERRSAVIEIKSLDPALAKVPFPVPTTYETVLRHYLDISAVAGRQILGTLSKFAPSESARARLQAFASDKELVAAVIGGGCLKLAEVLQLVAGDDIKAAPTPANTTVWNIGFDLIVSNIPRLQPRYYSISSSPKLNPGSIHVTAVVLKYESVSHKDVPVRWVYGVSSNLLLNLKYAASGETAPLVAGNSSSSPARVSAPEYNLSGPRGAYRQETIYRIPIHVRRSTFRLPTNPKSPVIMIGPGTGVAPFRGFVQERVALARRTVEKNGPAGLAEWGKMSLFYGCRRSDEDFLYKDEWPKYQEELGPEKFALHVALSRETSKKVYVQDLVWEDREHIADAILNKKGYIYICGEAKHMAKSVEARLARIFGEALGGTAEKEGMAQLKELRDRSRLSSDVWS